MKSNGGRAAIATKSRATGSIQKTVEDGVERALNRGEVGMQVAVYHQGELVASAYGGVADQPSGRKVSAETVFVLASVTKAVTATALHIQAERGLVEYNQPVAKYWPEFAVNGKDRGTVYDALSHRLGVPIFPWNATPELAIDFDWVVRHIGQMHPLYEPGTKNCYHTSTFGYVLGEIVRRTDPKHRPFARFVHEEIFDPLGIDTFWFGIPDSVQPRVANDGARQIKAAATPGVLSAFDNILTVPPQVEGSKLSARPDARASCRPSGGGIADAKGVARFFALLANGGELNGVRLLSEERVRLFSAPRPPGWDMRMGMQCPSGWAGFWRADPSVGHGAPMGRGLQIFGHPGVGNLGWCDPKHRLAVGITSNRPDGRETPESNPLTALGNNIRKSLGIEG